jgi:hypothetical protein
MDTKKILAALETGLLYTRVEGSALEKLSVLEAMAELPNCPAWVSDAITRAQPHAKHESELEQSN